MTTDEMIAAREAREAVEAAEALEMAREMLAHGGAVVVRGRQGAFGGIDQWHDVVSADKQTTLSHELSRRFGHGSGALRSPAVAALLAQHGRALLDTESAAAAQYWRAVNG